MPANSKTTTKRPSRLHRELLSRCERRGAAWTRYTILGPYGIKTVAELTLPQVRWLLDNTAEAAPDAAEMPLDELRMALYRLCEKRGFTWARDMVLKGKYPRLSLIPEAEVRVIYACVCA
jgi:hypothetical protein